MAPLLRDSVARVVPVLETSLTLPVGVPEPLAGLTWIVTLSRPPVGSAVVPSDKVVTVARSCDEEPVTITGDELLAVTVPLPAYSAVIV